MSAILLLVSSKPEDQIFAAEAAATSGLMLRVETDPVQAGKVIETELVGATLADVSSAELYQAFEQGIQSTVGLMSERINSNAIHFISSEDLSKIPYLIQSPLFGHYIYRKFGDPKREGTHYGRIIKATLSDRAFGIKGLLKPESKVQVVHLKNSSQKQDAVEAVKNFLVTAKFQTRMATVVANAMDELLMNAVFDAPIDEMGKATSSMLSRATLMPLEGPSAVEMHIGYDGDYVILSAVDHFGSLDKAKLMGHISKIYKEEEYKVKSAVAGAGIGLATVFRTGGSFFFISDAKVKTEVVVFFRRTDNFREFKDQFRFISTQFYF